MFEAMLRTGIDLGGTKIEIACFGEDGAVLLRERVATPQGDYRATVMTVADLILAAERNVGAGTTVGIGIPGVESRSSGLIKNANSTCLIGKPLKRDLEAVLQREVRLANDANCFALSEAIDGAGAGAQAVFGVILGTGVGGGIVIDGKLLIGANAIAGEWGHNPLAGEHHKDVCYCGRKSCIELYLSGPGMRADHRRVAGAVRVDTVPGADAQGHNFSAHEIAQRALAGDADCEATLQRYEARLARALAQVINILDPDVIVLGGGLSNIDRLYANVPRLWGGHVFSDQVATRLLKHRHGDSSGVRGAAWLWN
ncbi:MAG: ROK family protein [Candidatus Woesebacteria bacterium]|nr:ROK family protein [Candidatus Woesebacteria bacterium]